MRALPPESGLGMKIVYKVGGALVAAVLLPVGALGTIAVFGMRGIGHEAGHEAQSRLDAAEQGRLTEVAHAQALEIGSLLAAYEGDVEQLRDGFLAGRGSPTEAPGPGLHAGADTAGLPDYGFVHPVHGAYADYDHRSGAAPWLPRPSVVRARTDPAFRAGVTADLVAVMALNPLLTRVGQRRADTLDLAWVVLRSGVTNVYPPYDYNEVLARAPENIDLDESQEDYVRLLDPVNDPEREIRWLEPYLDPFKGIWMTSCVAPLYEGDAFIGTVGMDILLPVITRRVLALRQGRGGYAFLAARSGKLIAVPEAGISDLVWDAAHRAALLQTFRPPTDQRWTPDLEAALSGMTLDQAPQPDLAGLAAAMRADQPDFREIAVGERQLFVAFAPVGRTGWTLAITIPADEVRAPAAALEGAIGSAADRTARRFAQLALLLLVSAVAVGFFLHYTAVLPIVRLSGAVGAVRWESLDLAQGPDGRRDEIGQLQARFLEMLALIRASRDELTEKGRQIAAANAELALANQELKREIEQRHRAQEELSREKEHLAVTLRSIGDGVIATDVEGRIVQLNEVAETLTGWSQAAAQGRPLEQVFHIINEQTRQDALDPVRKVLATGHVVGLANHTALVARDGTERAIADSAAPIRDPRGGIVGVVLVFRDITSRRRMEEDLARAQKLESVRLLAAGIAHDFNNLLAAILGNLSLARHQAESGLPVAPTLDRAESATGRARELTTQLLTFSSGGAPMRRVFSIGPLLGESAGLALRGAHVRCELDVAADLWAVYADEGQLSQVLGNLLINADHAMPSGGTVRIVARNRQVVQGQHARLPADRYVEIAVIDEGVGIPAENLPRVFDPFFTTKPRGNGLGLAVCASIIDRHGGHMEVESTVGEGTTFRFLVPATGEAPVERGTQPSELPLGTGRILVMDDEDAIRTMCVEMLTMLGYEPQGAPDGSAAIELFRTARQEGRPFSAVVLDLTVPGGLGGEETLEELRKIDPDVRAIVSSGYAQDPILASHRRRGFAAAMAKPYTLRTLAETLDEVVGERDRSDSHRDNVGDEA